VHELFVLKAIVMVIQTLPVMQKNVLPLILDLVYLIRDMHEMARVLPKGSMLEKTMMGGIFLKLPLVKYDKSLEERIVTGGPGFWSEGLPPHHLQLTQAT